jgi:hypothetical protein
MVCQCITVSLVQLNEIQKEREMRQYQYLIIGGRLTGDAAARGIRELDPIGTIGMVGMEPDPPYARPSLSKGLWKGRPIEKIWRKTRELEVIIRRTGFDDVRRIFELEIKDK